MQFIVLTGLAVIEKQQLAQELVSHFQAVMVDNLKILPADAEIMIFVAPAQTSPDKFYAMLDALPTEVDVSTVAVIDTRTCDCFPNLRLTLEQIADVVINLSELTADFRLADVPGMRQRLLKLHPARHTMPESDPDSNS